MAGAVLDQSVDRYANLQNVTIAGGKIRAFVEQIENLDTELQELSEQKKEVFAKAKGEGFDVQILKEIINRRSRPRSSESPARP